MSLPVRVRITVDKTPITKAKNKRMMKIRVLDSLNILNPGCEEATILLNCGLLIFVLNFGFYWKSPPQFSGLVMR